jgi:hypothetical protein
LFNVDVEKQNQYEHPPLISLRGEKEIELTGREALIGVHLGEKGVRTASSSDFPASMTILKEIHMYVTIRR